MVSSILRTGDKVEIKVFQQAVKEVESGEEASLLKSVIYGINSDDELEIGMPIANGQLKVLSQGIRYSLLFYTKNGLYHCIGKVKDRYKSENLHVVRMELVTNLSKFQRREFYRYACLLDIKYLSITREEARMDSTGAILAHHRELFPEDEPVQATALDLSGGGLRFVSQKRLPPTNNLLIYMSLNSLTVNERFWVLGRALQERSLDEKETRFEYRIKFQLKDESVREHIIKYIFEEERKNRKGMSNL